MIEILNRAYVGVSKINLNIAQDKKPDEQKYGDVARVLFDLCRELVSHPPLEVTGPKEEACNLYDAAKATKETVCRLFEQGGASQTSKNEACALYNAAKATKDLICELTGGGG